MTKVRSDDYWANEFDITEADLDRIDKRLNANNRALNLTELAQRVIRGRLRHGQEISRAVLSGAKQETSVRLWDPAGKWEAGDHVIVPVGFYTRNGIIHEPHVGEIIATEPNQVRVEIEELQEPRRYSTKARYSDDDLHKWKRFVENLVEARRDTSDEREQIEYVLLEHGERVTSRLMDALKSDERFVYLNGRWFLRDLTKQPREAQLRSLAWNLLHEDEPLSTEELVALVEPPLPTDDSALVGLYLALRARSDLFRQVNPGQRPKWKLTGPPPGECEARHAAYDPYTYEILCVKGQLLGPKTVRRLWDTKLLDAIA